MRLCRAEVTAPIFRFLPTQLVASLERMLQQPAAAQPGRAAISALRQSQTAEVGAAGGSGGGTSSLARTSSSSFGRTASGLAFRSTTLSTEGGAFGTAPAAAGAAPSRWRLVADRAASFKPPRPSSGGGLGGWGGSGVWAGGDAAGSSSMQASPAADLLAEIDRVVSPTASPAASPSFSYLAPAHGSPTACAATLPFASLASPAASPAAAPLARLPPPAWQAAAQQQAQQLLALQAAEQAHQAQQQVQQQQECTPPGRPAAAGAAASRWNAVAAGPAACSSPGAASPVTTFDFAAPSPSPAAPLGLSSGGEVSVERVELPVQRFRLGAAPGGTRWGDMSGCQAGTVHWQPVHHLQNAWACAATRDPAHAEHVPVSAPPLLAAALTPRRRRCWESWRASASWNGAAPHCSTPSWRRRWRQCMHCHRAWRLRLQRGRREARQRIREHGRWWSLASGHPVKHSIRHAEEIELDSRGGTVAAKLPIQICWETALPVGCCCGGRAVGRQGNRHVALCSASAS